MKSSTQDLPNKDYEIRKSTPPSRRAAENLGTPNPTMSPRPKKDKSFTLSPKMKRLKVK
ncbi:hypothetical protein LINPERPRIM_LOCUS25046 [Linum perenne]